MYSKTRCPDCGGESSIDPKDPEGLSYKCDVCGNSFKTTFDDLYGSIFNKPIVDVPGHLVEMPPLQMLPAIGKKGTRVRKVMYTRQSEPTVTTYPEPPWIANDESWKKFKEACKSVGIGDPWTIVQRDRDVDLATFFLNIKDGGTNFPKVMERYLPYEKFVLMRKKIREML